MRAFLIGGAFAALGIAAAPSAAQTSPPPGVAPGTMPARQAPMPPPGIQQQMRVRMMSDHVMTREELAAHVAKLFAKLDANHDGFITKDEVEAFHSKMMGAMAEGADVEKRLAEHSGVIGDRGAMFDRLDTNHDGMISREEFMAGRPEMREERVMVMRGGPDGAHGAPGALPPMDGHSGMGRGMEMHMRHMGGDEMGTGFAAHLFEMADTNHDGRVSLAEAQAAALAHFDRADLNHDGRITPEERAKVHEEMGIERHPG
jgi:Ca2+-binding EF-hand superfamily protein